MRAALWHFGFRFALWELMSTPRLDPRQRVTALAGAGTLATAGVVGWELPRMLRWIATGQGTWRPSRHTAWPAASGRLPRALLTDLETLRHEAEDHPGCRPAG